MTYRRHYRNLIMYHNRITFQKFRCAYVIVVMAILWLTEAIPIPATALLPIFMFPMLQVADARQISSAYVNVSS